MKMFTLNRLSFITLLTVILHYTVDAQATNLKYYSQCGQDSFIHQNYFPNKTDGVYVEIGAHDGINISNTYFFEQLGWRGMCIEPITEIFEILQRNRNENCICIEGAISDNDGTASFMYVKGPEAMLSGLIDKYDPRHADRVQRDGKSTNCEFILRTVQCYKLCDLLEKYDMHHIDYLSIDTEGGELDILKTIDYSKFDIDVITVEDNFGYPEIKSFLNQKGFAFMGNLRHDLLFRNKKYCY